MIKKINDFLRIKLTCKIKVKKGNKLITNNARIKDSSIVIIGKNNIVEFGKNCNFTGLSILVIGNNNIIQIGRNTKINASKIQPTIINAAHGSKIIIGDNCLFSNNIEIHSSDYHKILNNDGAQINIAKDIRIGNHVWIGLRTIILKGTFLGDNVIVGAGSLLTSHFETNNCILAGNPPKIIKDDVNWEF